MNPDSETARLLREAASAVPIRVDTGEAVYRVAADETRKPYDPERMVKAIDASAGILKRAGVDAEQLEKDIYADRTQNSTGRPAEYCAPCSTPTSSSAPSMAIPKPLHSS